MKIHYLICGKSKINVKLKETEWRVWH